MTGEEMERAIAFILEQQAQFAANQQRHEETMHRIEAAQELTAQQVQHIGAAMLELTEAHTRTEAKVGALADRLGETDERLNTLVNTVERLIEGRNGS